MGATIDELTVADAPAAWAELGFAVEGDTCVVGEVRIRLAGRDAGKGLVGWSLCGVEGTELDGLVTSARNGRRPMERLRIPTASPPSTTSSRSAPTSTAPSLPSRRAGLDLRRVREEPTPAGAPRQAFFRLGAAILEVVQEPPEAIEWTGGDRPAFFWGLAFVAPDLEATVARLGEHASEVRDAVQPGRRIATLRRSAGLALPVALMTPAA